MSDVLLLSRYDRSALHWMKAEVRRIMMMYVWLIIGFVLLVKGADFFVDGSSSVAKTLRVPTLIIGLTIVAFGTSCPEAAVSITASIAGKNDMAFSNVIGSNIFNLLVVVGMSALFHSVQVDAGMLKREFPLSIIVAVLILIFALPIFGGDISRIEGIILLVIFAGFIAMMIKSALSNRTEQPDDDVKVLPIWLSIIYIVGGIAAIVIGGNVVVDSATDIALSFGMTETLVGLTIVALGTSLPELVTSIVAARKGESDLALGNAIGSNLFNILFVLASAATISPVAVGVESLFDTAIFIVFSLIVLFMVRKDRMLVRWKGEIMILMYAAYMVYIILR